MSQAATKQTLSPSVDLPSEQREQIASIAYGLWQSRGCPEGSPEEDWFRAEEQLHIEPGLAPSRIKPRV